MLILKLKYNILCIILRRNSSHLIITLKFSIIKKKKSILINVLYHQILLETI